MLLSRGWLSKTLSALCLLEARLVFALPSRDKTCTILSQYTSSNGTADDSEAIAQAFVDCSSDAVITFSEGVDYNVFEPIVATNLSNVEIRVEGNLHLPQNISYVQ